MKTKIDWWNVAVHLLAWCVLVFLVTAVFYVFVEVSLPAMGYK